MAYTGRSDPAGASPGPPSSSGRIVIEPAGHAFEPRPSHAPGIPGADTECDGWSTAAFTLRWAAVRGDWHRYYHQPRQDQARAAVHRPTGAVVFAVADGVSSAESADVGALEACCAAIQEMLDQLDRVAWPGDPAKIVAAAAGALRQRAAQRLGTAEPSDEHVEKLFATTLVAGTILAGPSGTNAALVRIGDSCAWVLDGGTGEYRALFRPKSEHVVMSNSVASLPRIPPQPERVMLPLEPRLILLVGTDGFGDPLGDGTGPVGALFAEQLIPAAPAPLSFARLLDFSRETYDDDRALLAIWSHPEPT
jgi:Protein phosphatase 2C